MRNYLAVILLLSWVAVVGGAIAPLLLRQNVGVKHHYSEPVEPGPTARLTA